MRPSSVREFFQWKHSRFVGVLLGVTGISMVLMDKFIVAYVACVLAGAWSVGCWLTSELLAGKKRFLKNRKIRKNPNLLKQAQRIYFVWRWGISLALVFISTVALAGVRVLQVNHELRSLHGWLIPANDPLPPNPCGEVPDKALLIFLGGATSYTTTFPHTVIEIDERPRLVIDRNRDNSIAVSVDIFGSDGKIIAELNKNEFTVNEHNYFKTVRKDRNSLVVIDDHKNEVLSVRYLNPKAIWINAVLRYPGSNPIVIRGPGGGGACFGENRTDMSFKTK